MQPARGDGVDEHTRARGASVRAGRFDRPDGPLWPRRRYPARRQIRRKTSIATIAPLLAKKTVRTPGGPSSAPSSVDAMPPSTAPPTPARMVGPSAERILAARPQQVREPEDGHPGQEPRQ